MFHISTHRRLSHAWPASIRAPVWKGKGGITDCLTSRLIRLISNTLEVFWQIISRRLREIMDITSDKYRFVRNSSATDAIKM